MSERKTKRTGKQLTYLAIAAGCAIVAIWMISVSSTLSALSAKQEQNSTEIRTVTNTLESQGSTLGSIYDEAKSANSNASQSYDEARYVCISISACFNGRD